MGGRGAAAARRERIIREEVERRLIEEEVCRELALARARLHGELVPEPFFRVDVPFMPPMPADMRPSGPPQASFGLWQGPGLQRQRPSRLKHRLEPLKIAPNESSEVLPSGTEVYSVKSKVDDIAVTTEPTPPSEANISGAKRKVDVIAAATEPTKSQKAARDWSCALCQVPATSEASLNTHLQGKKHRAKLARCEVIGDFENGLKATKGNKDSGCPTDAPRKICILVDGSMHEVIQKRNYLWCERCRLRCQNNVSMADHLRGKKHSELNKVWRSIKAVRLNKSMESSAATCKRKVYENGPIQILDPNELNENGPVQINGEMEKETTDMAIGVNENSLIEVEIKKEGTAIAWRSE